MGAIAVAQEIADKRTIRLGLSPEVNWPSDRTVGRLMAAADIPKVLPKSIDFAHGQAANKTDLLAWRAIMERDCQIDKIRPELKYAADESMISDVPGKPLKVYCPRDIKAITRTFLCSHHSDSLPIEVIWNSCRFGASWKNPRRDLRPETGPILRRWHVPQGPSSSPTEAFPNGTERTSQDDCLPDLMSG